MNTFDDRLAQIRARLAATTPRTALFLEHITADDHMPCFKGEHWALDGQVAHARSEVSRIGIECERVNVGCWNGEKADAEFIQHAFADMAVLLAEIDDVIDQLDEVPEYAPREHLGESVTIAGRVQRLLGVCTLLREQRDEGRALIAKLVFGQANKETQSKFDDVLEEVLRAFDPL